MASATEAELGCLFENCQKATSMRTALADMGHPQPPTTTHTGGNRQHIGKKNSQCNGKAKNILCNRHDILLGQRQNPTKPFPHIMGRGKGKPVRLFHNAPPGMAT